MYFELNDEQRALRQSVRGLLDRHARPDQVRAVLDTGAGYDEELWRRMAGELGLAGLAVPEPYGGDGQGLVELAVVFEELGAALAPSPLFASAVLGATTLLGAGDAAARGELLPAVVAGERILSAAVDPRPGDGVVADRAAGGWALTGAVSGVVDGAYADLVLLAAHTALGPTLFALDPRAGGVTVEPEDVLDATRPMARLTLADAPARPLAGSGGETAAVLAAVRRTAAVVLAAEQVGTIRRCLDLTVRYASTRVQFDRPIGGFQAVKHLCADMFVGYETARSAMLYAAWSVDHDAADRDTAVHLAKAYCADACHRAAAAAIQVHGGIGFTWDHDCHLLYKRAVAGARMLGSAAEHREELAAAMMRW